MQDGNHYSRPIVLLCRFWNLKLSLVIFQHKRLTTSSVFHVRKHILQKNQNKKTISYQLTQRIKFLTLTEPYPLYTKTLYERLTNSFKNVKFSAKKMSLTPTLFRS